jgi:hypothetical protein
MGAMRREANPVTGKWFGRRALKTGAGLAMVIMVSTGVLAAPAMAAAGRTGNSAPTAGTQASSAPAHGVPLGAQYPRISPFTAQFFTFIPDNVIAYECLNNYDFNFVYRPITGFRNECNERVWLHQVQNWRTNRGAWTYCVSPYQYLPAGQLPAKYQNPLNIYISSNANPC